MFKNTTSEVNIGGFPYINNYLHIYLPYSIVSCIATFLGLAGNILVVAAVLVDRKLRTNPTCILIVNLAFSDLLISIFVHPSIIIGVFFGKSFFDRHMNLCVFLGAACLISCGTSLMNMLFLALNRYISVFYFKKYSKYFSIRNTISLALIAWFIGIMADLPNFFGIGDHVYDLKVLSCHFDRLKVPYTFSFLAFCIILPGVFIGFLYLRIFLYAYRIRSKLKYRRNILKYGNALNAIKIAQSLFASFFTFFICWIPVAIVMFMGTDDQLPISAHTFANLAAHVNSALNPILYLIFNPKMRTGYANLLRLVANNQYEFKRPTLTEKVASAEQQPKQAAVDEFSTNS